MPENWWESALHEAEFHTCPATESTWMAIVAESAESARGAKKMPHPRRLRHVGDSRISQHCATRNAQPTTPSPCGKFLEFHDTALPETTALAEPSTASHGHRSLVVIQQDCAAHHGLR